VRASAAPIARPRLADVAAAVSAVPALPRAVRAVINACEDPDTGADDVARLILSDQGLTANVLKLANSAAYGHRRRVGTATDAVVIMGVSAVRSLAISSHTANLLSGELPGYVMARGDLWRHSLAVAFVCRGLPGATGPRAAEEAFVAGLLHDVGKLVMSDVIGASYELLVRTAWERRRPLHECERELIGFDHAELGARIAAAWGFPAALVGAIGVHHRPDDAGDAYDLAHRVAVADSVCNSIEAGIGADEAATLVDPAFLAALELDVITLAGMLAEMEPAMFTDPLPA
jgi:putative nucleotidyltransferase with HDIG domain